MSGNTHLKPVTPERAKEFSHYLAVGEQMLYFTGLANTYLVRKFCFRFLFPGVPLIIAVTVGGYLAKYPLIYALLAGYGVAALVALIMNYFDAKGTQYILTNRRLIMQLGYFNVSLTSAAYDKITQVDVKQSFIEMSIYKFGKVVIRTAGSRGKSIVLKNIAHPIQFKNHLERLIDEAQNRHIPVADHTPKWKKATRKNNTKLLRPIQ